MRLLRFVLSLAFLAAFVAAVVGVAAAMAFVERCSRDLPDYMALKDYVPRQGSLIEAADGTFLSRHADQRRTFVRYGGVPKLVVDAFVAAEDRNYWTHAGVDPLAVVRAAVSTASGGVASGASTIDQQVAKNLLVGSERSLVRKVREAVLAIRMDRDIGKSRVFEIYANEIYLGQGAYGVAEAAATYFGKGLSQLDASEAAVLASLPKAPSAYNPVKNPRRALERRNYVLRRMSEDGYIAVKEAQARIAEPIRLVDRRSQPEVVGGGQGGWFEDAGWRVATQEIGQDSLSKRDVVVRTTERPALQVAAEAALRRGIARADQSLGWRGTLGRVGLPVDWSDSALDQPDGVGDFQVAVVEQVASDAVVSVSSGERYLVDAEGRKWTGAGRASEILKAGDVVLVDPVGDGRARLAQKPVVDGAMVVLDPRTGDVLAMVGGFSHDHPDVFNRATMARRQPGSAFKPIVYAAALQLGFDATSPLIDAPIVLVQGPGLEDWRPRDAKTAGKGGLITVRRALEKSRNMATVRVLWSLGLDDVEAMARGLGFTFGKMTYPMALGAGDVTPMQMALAYSAFANGGKLPTARFVSDIKTRSGEVLRAFEAGPGVRAVDPVAAAQMASILKGVPERGTAAAAFSGFVRHIAGKTGTTNSARDAWFVGFAGDFVAVVWIGRNDNKPLADGETGGLLAAPVVRDFLTAAGGEFSFLDPPVPDGLVKLVVDPDTGLAARKGVEELLRPERADALRSKGPPPKGDAGDAESGGREAAPAKGMREESEPRDAGPKEYAE